MNNDAIQKTLLPVTHDLGGFSVHRVLPSSPHTMVGPFIFFDQMGPATLAPGQGIDVRPHPHIGLSTVTWLFDGAIDHRDSLGSVATITPGAVNLMTAGSGIVHSERSGADVRARGAAISGIQTWLALPDHLEEMAPSFEHTAQVPIIADGTADGTVDGAGHARCSVIMGTLWGQTSPVTCHADTVYADVVLGKGGRVPVDAVADERAVYVALGEASLDGVLLQPRTLYVLRPGTTATLRSETGGRVMLCGGAVLDPAPDLLELRVVVARPTAGGHRPVAAARLSTRAR